MGNGVSSSTVNATSPTDPEPRRRLSATKTQIGLAIGFGFPFLVGLLDLVFDHFGWSWGPHIGLPWLCGELLILATLLALVRYWERLPLASVGLHWPEASDFTHGVAAFLFLMGLMIAIPPIYSLIYQGSAGNLSKGFEPLAPGVFTDLRAIPLWLAIAIVIAAGITTELAVRGYGIERLQALTGSVAAGAAAALVLDLLAHLPIWGLRYTIMFAPVQLGLIALYLWRRRLVPCIVANLLMGISGFLILSLQATNLPPSDHLVKGHELFLHGQSVAAIKELDAAIDADPNNAYGYLWRGYIYSDAKQYDLAIADLSRAIRLAPEVSDGYQLPRIRLLLTSTTLHTRLLMLTRRSSSRPKTPTLTTCAHRSKTSKATSRTRSPILTPRFALHATIAVYSSAEATRIRVMAITIARCSTTAG